MHQMLKRNSFLWNQAVAALAWLVAFAFKFGCAFGAHAVCYVAQLPPAHQSSPGALEPREIVLLFGTRHTGVVLLVWQVFPCLLPTMDFPVPMHSGPAHIARTQSALRTGVARISYAIRAPSGSK
jgi:hypothetical protein